jgi:hypothetical protein
MRLHERLWDACTIGFARYLGSPRTKLFIYRRFPSVVNGRNGRTLAAAHFLTIINQYHVRPIRYRRHLLIRLRRQHIPRRGAHLTFIG